MTSRQHLHLAAAGRQRPSDRVDLARTTGADQLVRAVKETTAPAPIVLGRYAYDYDLAGNRTTEQIDDRVTRWTQDVR